MSIVDQIKEKVCLFHWCPSTEGRNPTEIFSWQTFHFFVSHAVLIVFWCDLSQCTTELSATHVACLDQTAGNSCDGGAKLELHVVSAEFEGVPLLKRHRRVNEVLAEFMEQIHAITIKAWTPAQYEAKK